jgi:metal-responsive CopG/Arc/MetJ family transcriptional regulator
MHPHSEPHQHVHIELPKEVYEALKRLHPRYGERSRVIRKLIASYVKECTLKHEREAA